MKYILSIFVSLSVLAALVGCESTKGLSASTSYNEAPLTVAVPENMSSAEVQKVMAATFAGRQWTVTESSANSVTAILNHRGYQGKATMAFSDGVIRILNESKLLDNKSGEYLPAVPLGWLENLQKDLRKNLTQASYGSFR